MYIKDTFLGICKSPVPLMLWNFRIFKNNHSIKHLESASHVLSVLLSKLLLVTSMVEKWKVCQIKNVSICVLPLLSKYYCYLWNIFWWSSQGDYAVNSYIHWWKITNLCLDKYFHEEYFKKSKLFLTFFFFFSFLPYSYLLVYAFCLERFSKITWVYVCLPNLPFRLITYRMFVFFSKELNFPYNY